MTRKKTTRLTLAQINRALVQRLRAQRRAVFLAHARERLAQAAQAVVLEIDLARGGER